MAETTYEANINALLPSDFIKQLGDTAIKELVSGVTSAARQYWVAQAEGLVSTREAYIRGIQPVKSLGGANGSYAEVITLVGAFANALENGQDAYDMHDTLLGPNVPVVAARQGLKGKHEKKGGGFYRVIPFRHQSPTSQGYHGAPMGSAYAGHALVDDAAALGKAIYAQAKKLTPTTGMPGGKIKWGTSLPAGLAPKLKEHHATDIYAGMYRQSKTYEKATQNSFVSFRTIGTGSPGWMRKAVAGLRYVERVKSFTEGTLIKEAFEALLEGAK